MKPRVRIALLLALASALILSPGAARSQPGETVLLAQARPGEGRLPGGGGAPGEGPFGPPPPPPREVRPGPSGPRPVPPAPGLAGRPVPEGMAPGARAVPGPRPDQVPGPTFAPPPGPQGDWRRPAPPPAPSRPWERPGAMAPDDPRRMGVQGGAGDPAGASRVPVSRMGEAPREVAQAPASAPPGVAPGPASRLPEALRVALRPESLAMLAVFLGVAALAALARARKRQPRPNVRARRGVAASEAGGEAAPERDRVRFAPDDARQVREREVRRRTDEDWLRADRERFVRMRREEVREERLRAEAERRRAEAERGRAGERRRNDGQGPRADSSRTGGSGRDGAGLEGSRDVKDREWARRILGVPPGATPGEVRKAYIAGMKANHPDQASTLGEEVQALFSERAKLLNIAYDILRDQDA